MSKINLPFSTPVPILMALAKDDDDNDEYDDDDNILLKIHGISE